MLRRSQTLLLTFLTLAFTGLAVQAEAKDFVLEDWDGPAPVKNWYSNPSLDTKGWAPVVSDPLTFSTWTGATWWAPRGLYATAKFALFAGPGTGEWQWQAPGSSTVYRAEYGPAITRTVGCVNEGMRTSTGAWQPTVNGAPGWTARTSAHPTACTPGAWVPWTPSGQVFIGALGRQVFCSTSGCGRTGSPTGNRAVFGVQRTRAVQPQFDAYLPGARLYLTDYDKPTVTAGTNSLSDWVNTGTGTVSATATDAGLGVKSVTVTGPTPLAGSPATKITTLSCTGDRNDRCPATWNTGKPNTTASLSYDVATLPEGINAFTATATDIVDNTSTANTTAIPAAKVDRTAPGNITATGSLVDGQNHYFNGNDPQTVTITATDPAAANGQQLSGIRTIRIEEAGGVTLATKTIACAGAGALGRCPQTVSEELRVELTALPEGKHSLRAVVADLAGNTNGGSQWEIVIDRTAPPQPINVRITDYDPSIDTTLTFAWDETEDPVLSDGTAGSGAESWTADWAVGTASGSTVVTDAGLVLESAIAGAPAVLSVRFRDRAGNVSAPGTLSVGALAPVLEDPVLSEAAIEYGIQEEGLTRTQSEGWVATQDAVADAFPDGVSRAVRDAVGSEDFGGVWFSTTAPHLVVALLASGSADAVATSLNGAGLAGKYRVTRVLRSLGQLNATHDTVLEQLAPFSDIHTLGIDTSSNRVVLAVPSDLGSSDEAVVQNILGQPTPPVLERRPRAELEFDDLACGFTKGDTPLAACDPPLRGGTAISIKLGLERRGVCTAGLYVWVGNNRKMVTAGHCNVESGVHLETVPKDGVIPDYLGVFERTDRKTDRALVDVVDDMPATANVFVTKSKPDESEHQTKRNPHYRLKRAALSQEGSVLCFAGAITGTTCGKITDLNVSSDGVDGLGKMRRACVRRGDSGGPVFRHHRAYGIVSQGNRGLLGLGCTMLYAGAVGAFDEWNLSLRRP